MKRRSFLAQVLAALALPFAGWRRAESQELRRPAHTNLTKDEIRSWVRGYNPNDGWPEDDGITWNDTRSIVVARNLFVNAAFTRDTRDGVVTAIWDSDDCPPEVMEYVTP